MRTRCKRRTSFGLESQHDNVEGFTQRGTYPNSHLAVLPPRKADGPILSSISMPPSRRVLIKESATLTVNVARLSYGIRLFGPSDR